MLWYWLFAGPALVLAALSLGGERKRAAYVAWRLSEASGPGGAPLPPASVIVPVKGEDQGLRQNLAASVIASVKGYRLAELALVAQLFPGTLKGFNRARLAKAALPEYEAWFRRRAWVHVIWVPLATWIWLVGLAASAFGNTIAWRGHQCGLKRGASIIST